MPSCLPLLTICSRRAGMLTGLLLVALTCLAHPGGYAQETAPAAATDQKPTADETTEGKYAWRPLFDGKSLEGWKTSNFGGEGEIEVEDGVIDMGMGSPLTGITCTQKMPTCDYELQIEARRIDGNDFFGTITFPVNESYCSLIVGGWGGAVVGISCINRADASENETTSYMRFDSDQWYRIKVQVRKDHLRGWINDTNVVDLDIKNRQLSTRPEVFLCEPLGIANYITRAGIRKIELRQLPPETSK